MPIEGPLTQTALDSLLNGLVGVAQIGFIILFILYFFFSLIVVRQVKLMTETVMTEGGPLLRFLSILHSGLSLGLVVLYIGFV